MAEPEALYMVRLALDVARLAELGADLRLPRRYEDDGLVLHGLLAALFGKGAVQPFHLETEKGTGDRPPGRHVPVLGYSTVDGEGLREHADAFADPRDHAACTWGTFAVKEMPRVWKKGASFGFEARVCPVVRLSSAVNATARDGSSLEYKASSEVDAWIHRRFLRPNPGQVTREEVYSEWFASRLAQGASLVEVRLTSFRRSRLVRRTQGTLRKPRLVERPDATLCGVLEVKDGAAFSTILRRGIGRHGAFGFGMLLLRKSS